MSHLCLRKLQAGSLAPDRWGSVDAGRLPGATVCASPASTATPTDRSVTRTASTPQPTMESTGAPRRALGSEPTVGGGRPPARASPGGPSRRPPEPECGSVSSKDRLLAWPRSHSHTQALTGTHTSQSHSQPHTASHSHAHTYSHTHSQPHTSQPDTHTLTASHALTHVTPHALIHHALTRVHSHTPHSLTHALTHHSLTHTHTCHTPHGLTRHTHSRAYTLTHTRPLWQSLAPLSPAFPDLVRLVR